MASGDAKRSGTTSTPTTTTRPNRLPAPTLFVGPPSRNASQLSLSKQIAEDSPARKAREPLAQGKSHLLQPGEGTSATDGLKPPNGPPKIQLRKPSDKSLETKWREMQDTLDEVELTAQSATHVFSAKHAAALDELRRTQVELAKSWAQSNDGAGTPTAVAAAAGKPVLSDAAQKAASNAFATDQRKRGDTGASASTQFSGESEVSETTFKSDRSHLGDDATEDIRLANERRIANEAYFKKVDQNVRDVVTKLEAVAAAMRDVEDESRSLWSSSSISSRSLPTGQDRAESTT